jgi:hypothetical protein
VKLPQAMTFTGRDGSADRTDWQLAALNSYDGRRHGLPYARTALRSGVRQDSGLSGASKSR